MSKKSFFQKTFTLFSVLILSLAFIPSAHAAALTNLSDTLSRLKNSSGATVYANHTIAVTLGGSTALNAGETIVIDLDDDFGVTGFANTETEDFDIQVALTDESIVAAGGCAANDAIEITAINGTDKSFTFTACTSYTAEAPGSIITIKIGTHATTGGTGDDQISNPSTTQTSLIALTAAGDTGTVAVAIIDDDQIPVTASVNPSITFTVATTTLALSVLDPGSVSTSGANNISIGTNGSGGYTITVRGYGNGTNDGLYNTGASKLIPSTAAVLSAGTEGYGGQCQVSGTPSGACNAAFNYWATNQVGELGTSAATFASYGSKPAATDTFQIRVKATISTTTDAGLYADTLTLIGTANF